MTSEAMIGKRERMEDQWVKVSKEKLLEIVGRCLEIAIRTVFENFPYNFGGRIYLHKDGGPIGNRLTIA